MIEENELMRDAKGRFLEGHNFATLKRLYQTPQDLEEAIDQFFANFKKEDRTPTLSALALALGFKSRRSLWMYGERDEYAPIIEKAKLMIESMLEERLVNQKTFHPGLIFCLKNYGWSDKQEVDVRSQNITLSGFTLNNPDEDKH